MKKIIFILMLFLALIYNVEAYSYEKFSLGEKVPNMHIESRIGNNYHNGIPFILKSDTGKIVYCTDPFKKINVVDNYRSYDYNNSIFNLSDEQLNRMNLIAYYGYMYKNHIDIKWYGVTQFLIWRELKLSDIYFTDTYNGNRVDYYKEEINEIEKLVDGYYLLPSFANKTIEYDVFTNYVLQDENLVLKDFEIVESNIDSYIKNNELCIDIKKDGIYNIEFIKHSPVEENYILYGIDEYQPLLYPGKFQDIEFSLTIEVNSGSVTINKLDSENKTRKEAVLEGAEYGLYNDTELITTIITNKDGIGFIENLPLGKYYVKEIKPSLGYKLDDNIYEFEITKQNKNIVITSYENIIKGNIIINKYYGEKDNYKKEDGAIFEIYDVNNNLVGSYKTKNGVINEAFEYGTYEIKQVNGISGYDFIESFKVNVNNNEDYIYDLYDEKNVLVVDVPNTAKNDYDYYIYSLIILLGFILIIKNVFKNIFD